MSSEVACPFTGAPAKYRCDGSRPEIYYFDSRGCGSFAMTRTVYEQLKHGKIGTPQGLVNCARRCLEVPTVYPDAISMWVTRIQAETSKSHVASDASLVECVIDNFLEEPVDHAGKPYDLLRRFAEKMARDSAYAKFKVKDEDVFWARISDTEELAHVLGFLRDKRFINFDVPATFAGYSQLVADVFNIPLQMTVDGWAEIRERHEGVVSNRVFIAAQFSWGEAEEKLRQEAVEAIRLACLDCGYEASLVTQNHTGFITDRIIAEIKRARFVVADLTYNNRGAYFEAGLARGLDIPVFHVVRDDHTEGDEREGKRVHFDVQQVRYLRWATPGKLREELRDWIEATVGRYRA